MSNFGLLNEQILTSLEKKYAEDKKGFSKGLSSFVKTLKESAPYNDLYTHYNLILETYFEDANYARDYLDQSIDYLRSVELDPKVTKLMEGLDRTNLTVKDIDPHVAALDTLVFSNKRNIKEHVEAKQLLLKKLTTESKKTTVDPKLQGVFLDLLESKLKTKWGSLTESEVKAAEAFSDNNEAGVLDNYTNIINDNVSIIEEQLKGETNTEVCDKLSRTKDMLLEMKDKKPTLVSLEKLFSLKEVF